MFDASCDLLGYIGIACKKKILDNQIASAVYQR